MAGCLPDKYSVTPDGKIAFHREKSIYVTDKDVSFLNEIVSAEPKDVEWVEWSPDGKQLLYISDGFYIVDRDGKNKKKISTQQKPFFIPEWSPDMNYISYCAESETNKDEGYLYLHNIATGQTKILAKNSGFLHKWSPDGRKILAIRMLKLIDKVFKSGDEIMSGEIITVDVATGLVTPYAPWYAGGLTAIDYHPASQSILFASMDLFLPGKPITPDEELKYGLYAVNLASRRISRITNDEPIMYFCLSPKKEKILYVVSNHLSEPLPGDVYVMDINGRNKVRIGKNIHDFVPFWASEDIVGHQDWFNEDATGRKTVWLFDLKTGKRTDFTERVDQTLKKQ
jgi:Tol biopolymer transport system component